MHFLLREATETELSQHSLVLSYCILALFQVFDLSDKSYFHLVGNVHAEEEGSLVLSDGGDVARPDLQLVARQLLLVLSGKCEINDQSKNDPDPV
jgi:hypothetical protein